jgi:response regulator RpfG family c-di-GMP phosphodiesterase
VLIVDDEPGVRRGLRRLVERSGHVACEADCVASARRCLANEAVDVMVLDVALPDASGLSLLGDSDLLAQDVSVIVFTGSEARDDMLASVAGGAASFLRKSVDSLTIEAQILASMGRTRARRRSQVERRQSESSLAEALAITDQLPHRLAERLCSAWDLRHVETGAHVRRIGAYSEVLARALGVSAGDAALLGKASMLHDIGKISIPDAILCKPGKLTGEELATMKLHTRVGAGLLTGMGHPFLDRAASVALYHHERWDGSGYPDGLRGEECPLDARIVAVADVYDALGQTRCYKDAWSEERIESFFLASAGKAFEARIVEALLGSVGRLRALAIELPDSNPLATSAVFPVAALAVGS